MSKGNMDLFELHLSEAYNELFVSDKSYAYIASKSDPLSLAKRMTLALSKGCGDKGGKGIKIVCKKLGIKHTYRAIEDYLNRED